ncbi:GNAT family N-acetyltransferase [Metallococcus carri]|nr:GNAT family N-acetyltransferase [Metallococcus carri]
MSAYTGGLPGADGRFRTERLDHALGDTIGWLAWIAMAGPHPIGFALVRALDEPEHVLNSFFIVPGARRSGLGRQFARVVLLSRPGRWAIAYQDTNPAAAAFWPDLARGLDPHWAHEHRSVPGRSELPPDHWIRLTITPPPADASW